MRPYRLALTYSAFFRRILEPAPKVLDIRPGPRHPDRPLSEATRATAMSSDPIDYRVLAYVRRLRRLRRFLRDPVTFLVDHFKPIWSKLHEWVCEQLSR